MALFGLISSDEELSADRARLAASKDFATRSIEDSSKYYPGETQHYNPETEKWEPPAKSSNEETPKSKTNPNAKTADGIDEITVTARQKTSFNINQFRTEIVNSGVLPTNRFLVTFTPPQSLRTSEALTLRCENATIPGVNFFTSQTIRYGYGQTERRPYLPTFNPITLSFIVDTRSTIIDYFNLWTNSIVNYNVSQGMYSGSPSPYVMSYKDDYISKQMQIYVYDYENKRQIKVTLYDAYPLSTTDVSLGWGQENEIMKYSVSLQYTHMTMEASQPVSKKSVNQDFSFGFDAQKIVGMTNPTNLDTTGGNLNAVDAARFTLFNGVPNPKF